MSFSSERIDTSVAKDKKKLGDGATLGINRRVHTIVAYDPSLFVSYSQTTLYGVE